MHSCEIAVAPPAQGAALLLELGTLIIESRASRPSSKYGYAVQKASGDGVGKETEEANRGALPKRPAAGSEGLSHLSPAKRNREQVGRSKHRHEESRRCGSEESAAEKIPSTSERPEVFSVFGLKSRLINGGRIPLRGRTEALWRDHTPLSIEVLLAPGCGSCREPVLLLERWTMSVFSRRNRDIPHHITSQWLLNAVRSQLHFSQISAWIAKLKDAHIRSKKESSPNDRQRKLSRETCNIKKFESNCDDSLVISQRESTSREAESTAAETPRNRLNVVYNLKIAEDSKLLSFQCPPSKHTFPITDIGSEIYLEVLFESLPRREEIPAVSCSCSAGGADKRKKSVDNSSVESNPSEESLSTKLAAVCSLTDTNSGVQSRPAADNEEIKNRFKRTTYSPELGIINSDMGCTSKISRKFPTYTPNVSEMDFHTLSSRGSTPERSDLNDSGYSCHPTTSRDVDPYQRHNKVPSENESKFNYFVDDRMQTPCSQKGKHRCNCDDESDQGLKDAPKSTTEYSETDVNDDEGFFRPYDKVLASNENAYGPQDRAAKDIPKYSRRHRKESRHRQLATTSKENTHGAGPTSSRKNDLISNRKARTCSSSDNSDGRSSPELVHYKTVCRNCNENGRHGQKSPEAPHTATTSIPILQASKFDHVNRFGNFRSTIFSSLKQQNGSSSIGGCQSREHCSTVDNNNVDFCPCEVPSCRESERKPSAGDDDYRPSAKKLISSYTQTDDMTCECGESLSPLCSECSREAFSWICNYPRSGLGANRMRRSEASHDLAAKQLPVARRGDRSSSETEGRDGADGSSGGGKVIDIKCDSSLSVNLNDYKCDNNRIFFDSVNEISRKNEPPPGTTSPNGEARTKNKPSGTEASEDGRKFTNDIENMIRKPKFKRLDRIFQERKEKKFKDVFLKKHILSEIKGNLPCHPSGDARKKNPTKETERPVPRRLYSDADDEDHASKTPPPCGNDHAAVPSVSEMDKFRYRLDSAASMVFHSRTGLPLTSSPAPLRRGKSSFDFDSSINSVSSIKSALYGSSDLEILDAGSPWSPSSSPGSPSHSQIDAPVFNYNVPPKAVQVLTQNKHSKFQHGTSSGLLGSFEESVLNGRLEPAATVAGFTAEIGASGEFCPPHLTLPVTVFFYSLGDNTTSSPYLGHINLGRKGYCVPRSGTIQVTLFNPHGTVVKMFVIMYDLEDMPPHSRTFLRQRTLWGGTCLRYLIHLRFLTSKSGKVYLHTDIRIIVSRKADLDTAAAHSLTSGVPQAVPDDPKDRPENGRKVRPVETGTFDKRSRKDKFLFEKTKLNRSVGLYEPSDRCEGPRPRLDSFGDRYRSSVTSAISKELSYEMRSFTYGPENPKYSPR